jgi:hypothetical protein
MNRIASEYAYLLPRASLAHSVMSAACAGRIERACSSYHYHLLVESVDDEMRP